MDKRLSFGKIVGKTVKMKWSGEVGKCEFWDKVEKVFLIALDSYKNKYNPDGICYCEREDFEVM